MNVEGKQLKTRGRNSADIERRYAIMCQPPMVGSFVAPLVIGDASQNTQNFATQVVAHKLKDLLIGIAQEDSQQVCSVLPDNEFRESILSALRKMAPPKHIRVEIALQSRSGTDLYVPSKAARFMDEMIHSKEKNIVFSTITVQLLGIDFEKRKLRLRYPPTRRELRCPYDIKAQDLLLENPFGLIQVSGYAAVNSTGDPLFIVNVEQIQEVDLSPISVQEFDVDGTRVVAHRPVVFQPVLDQTRQHFLIDNAPFGINLLADMRDLLERDIHEELDFLWRQYAEETEDVLSSGAVALKKQLLEAFKVEE